MNMEKILSGLLVAIILSIISSFQLYKKGKFTIPVLIIVFILEVIVLVVVWVGVGYLLDNILS